MTESQSTTAATILERLQQQIAFVESQRAPASIETLPANLEVSANRLPIADFAPLAAELETAICGNRDVGQINPRGPGLHNRVIQFAKKVMRRSLSWYTRPIHVFQGAVISAFQQIVLLLHGQQGVVSQVAQAQETAAERQEQFARQVADLRAELVAVSTGVASVTAGIANVTGGLDNVTASSLQQFEQFRNIVSELRAELNGARTELAALARQQRLRERDIRRFVDEVQKGETSLPSRPAPPVPPMFPSGLKRQDEFDYFMFEEKFRGNEAIIRGRQEEYLKHFEGRENVIDVGCGRGEFLELLRDNGIVARGVELGNDQFLLCREKGLDVVHEDLFSFLESLPDNSIGGLFSAQVIEHFTASDQLRFIKLAYLKTMPGSPVIFETINARCIFAIMNNFFLDPTHVRPVHPETLKFAMESVNFRNVLLQFSSPVADRHIPSLSIGGKVENLERFNFEIGYLNDLLYGSQDFAAIGWH